MHQVVIDASASMRGEREIFARGLAIALGKKLQLAGEEVWHALLRLAPLRRAAGDGRSLPAAWLLGFKGERGRNPARVFAQLATEIALLRARDAARPRHPPHHPRGPPRAAAPGAGGAQARAPLRRLHPPERRACSTSSGSTSSRATPSWITRPCSRRALAPPRRPRSSATRPSDASPPGRRPTLHRGNRQEAKDARARERWRGKDATSPAGSSNSLASLASWRWSLSGGYERAAAGAASAPDDPRRRRRA